MQLFSDLIGFLKTLSLIDIVFFFSVLVLMILVITLIYFIRENEYDISNQDNTSNKKKEENVITDLKEITKALEEAEPTETVINKYEEEQEEKAIISYDELLKRKSGFALNYSEEQNLDDEITIKKVDMDNLINKDVMEPPTIKVSVISYEKEEAFLKALKALQQHLN